MNRIYRLRWNHSISQWVAASELDRSTSGNLGSSGSVRARLTKSGFVAASASGLLLSFACASWATGPSGGQVTGGSGHITQNGNTTTVEQSSSILSLDWQSFNLSAQDTINFKQPNTSAIAVNRISSSSGSQIFGHLNANGQVWLLNPNGILFGSSAQVNVGGLVASALDLVDDSGDARRFTGSSDASVDNWGHITATRGGYVALMGHRVLNEGVITAELGTVALGAGRAETLTFSGNRLLHLQVDESALNDLVENRGLITANGGQVIMTAGAKDAVLASVVNNTGLIQAETVENRGGTITLLGKGDGSTINVGGTLDASAPQGGDAGSIETSAAHVSIAANTSVSAAAASGRRGTWLIDPTDLTIDAAAASTISGTLSGGTNVTETTSAGGASGPGTQSAGAGDININSAVSWTSAATFTLSALHGINVNAAVNGSGTVVMDATGGNLTINSGGSLTAQAGITLHAGANFVNQAGPTALSGGSGSRWLVYSTNPNSDTTGGLSPGFIQYNAPNNTTPQGTGNGLLYSIAPTLNVTALSGAVSKTYDGTTTALLTVANLATSGLIHGDALASATGSYATSDAASGINVTSPTSASALSISNAGIPVYGYGLNATPVTAAIGIITPAPLTAVIIGDPTKVYDGTITASLGPTNYQFSGFAAGQGATVNQPSSVGYDSANAGSRTVNATFGATNFNANAGTDFANYVLPSSASGAGNITQAPVNLTGLLANDKVYDGTAAASLNTAHAGIFGVIAGDIGNVSLDLAGNSGVFASANAGSGIIVAPAGFQLTGTKASNYQLIAPLDLTANITPKGLTVTGVSATNKVYDATAADPLLLASAQLSGLLAGDAGQVALSSSGAAGNFSTPNAGSGIGVTATGFVLTGAGTANYALSQPTGLTANIAPAPLTIALSGNPTKPYNGTITAEVSSGDFTITGFVAGQNATITQSALAQYAAPNAGSGIGVTATLEPPDFSLASGTALSNYSFPRTVAGTGTITAAPLTGYITNNPTKVYDGNTSGAVTSADYVLSGFVNSESAAVNQTVATYASANAGAETITTSLTAASFTAGSGTQLANYLLPTSLSGSGTITPKQLQGNYIYGTIAGNPTKTYDGTTTATLTPANFALTGFINTDNATVTKTTGAYASANAGSQNITVNVTNSDFSPQGGTMLSNYMLPSVIYGTGTINPAQLTVNIVGDPTKVYNGTTTAVLTSLNYQVLGFVPNEGATVTPSSLIEYAGKDAGAQNITATLTSTAYTATSGTSLSNYILATSGSGAGHITPAPLYVTGVSAVSKVYDTSAAATLNVATAGLAGLVSGESSLVSLTAGSGGVFSKADVGNGLAVTPAGFSLSGSGAANYALQPLAGLHANIAPAPLSVAGVSAVSRAYDATTMAVLDSAGASLNGILGGDNVTLTTASAAGTFASANAGAGLPVTASGYVLGGSKAADYALSQPIGLSADITPRVITASIVGNPAKAYDGSNSATLTATDYSLQGFVPGQGASVPQSATASYLSANAGNNVGLASTLVISDFAAFAGTNLSNYAMPATASGTLGIITPKVLNLNGTRVYDTTVVGDGTLFGTLSGINGDTLSVTGSGTLASKNVGSESVTGLGSLALSANGGALAGNYTLVGGVDVVRVTPAPLIVTGTSASDKVYDGGTTAALSGALLGGVLSGDTVNLGNDTSGAFDTKNVGLTKSVSTAMTVSGADAGNYTLAQPTNLTASISTKSITVAATGANKIYDANINDAAVLGSAGLVTGDHVTFGDSSAVFGDANVGTGKSVSVSGISTGGADAGNYSLINTTATTIANITPKVLNLTGTRQYDADVDASAVLFGAGGMLTGVNGETLTLSGGGTLASKNVNTTQGFASLSGFALNGDAGALASNYTLVGGTDHVNITPAPLSVTGTSAANKTYDGNKTASLSGATLNGAFTGDVVSLANAATGNFNNASAGNAKPVTASMTLTGTDKNNYTLAQPTGLLADITPRGITVAAAGSNKTYDGFVNDSVVLGSLGVVPGDNVIFGDSSSVFGDANAANGKTVTVSGISLGGSAAGNYTLNNTSATTTANITPKVIDLNGARVYDANTDAAASLFGTNGVLSGVNGETLTLSGTGILSSKDVNASQTLSSLSGYTLTGNAGALPSNYSLAGGSDRVAIIQLPITITASGVNKVYDGSLSDSATLASTGILGGDVVTIAAGSAVFANKDVGTAKTVSVSGITLAGTDAGNYSYNTAATTTANITAKPITIVASGSNKVYDGSTADAIALASGGIVSGDVVNFSSSAATFAGPNAANAKTVNVSGISLGGIDAGNYSYNTTAATFANIAPVILNLTGTRVYDGSVGAAATAFGSNGVLTGISGETLTLTGAASVASKNVNPGEALTSVSGYSLTGNGGTLAGNYTLAGGADTLAITPRAITVTATGANKVYDASPSDAGAGVASLGVLAGDHVTFSDTSAAFADKTVGNAKTVTVSGIAASGADAMNYSYNAIASATADITPAPLNVSGTVAADKVYDGTTAASLSGAMLTGVLGTDIVILGDVAAGTFDNKNAGNGKTVTTTMSLGGADAGNYALNLPNALTASVVPKAIFVAAAGINKVYDGAVGDAVTLNGVGVIAGDSLAFTDSSALFGDKNVGNAKTVLVSGITAGGADAGNYNYNSAATTAANITAKPIVVTATGPNKVYDGTTAEAGATVTTSGIVAGDSVNVTDTAAAFATKNVGTGKSLTVSGIALTGPDAGNYSYNSSAITMANVTPAPLSVAGTQAANKVYDGTTAAALSGSTLIGVFGDDAVALAGAASGLFDNRNVGLGKGVTTAMTLSGTDAGNYLLAQPNTLTASITPKPVGVAATGESKVFDGNTADTVLLRSSGLVPGDTVSFRDTSANFVTPAVGKGKPVSVSGITAIGADAGNYVLTNNTAATTADITISIGVQDTAVAAAYLENSPDEIITPYGVAPSESPGQQTGNKKMLHRPVERNSERVDFQSGLSLTVLDGGVRLPAGTQ